MGRHLTGNMFGALVLSASFTPFACSPLPLDQEVRVSFLVNGLMKIPLEFAYSETGAVISNRPKFATSKEEASRNIKQYIKKAKTFAIRQEARKDGIEKNVTDIEYQLKPTVYYSPLKCSSFIERVEPIPREGAVPLFCAVKDDLVTNVAYTAQGGYCGSGEPLPIPLYEVPLAHQQFTVSLAVGAYSNIINSIIAGWSREKWDLTLLTVERQFRSSTYAAAFRTVNIMQI